MSLREVPSEPVIGVCAVRERARWSFWDQEAHLVADSYIGFIQRAGAIAVLLPVDPRAPLALVDRIDALVGPAGRHPHRPVIGSFDGTDHLVTLAPGSLIASASGEEVTTAHCHHHQAIDRLGDGLMVSARADDGVIEAIEAADGRWILGVQWHPEAHETSRLFQALRHAAAGERRARATPTARSGTRR